MDSGTGIYSTATTSVMLAVDEKRTFPVQHYYPVRYYVLVHYSDTDFQNLEMDLQALNNLRSVVENPKGSLTHRRDLLINYFKALCSAASILPFSPHPDHINAVFFTWFDAFKKARYSSQPSLDLEKASVMFNLGAVYSQIGLSSDRSTTEGVNQALDNFRSAAGAFEYLRVRLAERAPATMDLSMECAWALERLMLAQARECFYQNTIANGSSHGVCAEISSQVGIYYKEALDGLNVVPLSQHFDKMWMTQMQLKAAIFSAESCYRHSLELHEKEKIGEEIARLEIGISALPDVKKFDFLSGKPLQLLAAVTKLKSHLSENLQKAIEENNSVYQQTVPCSSSLTTLPAASLPKPIPMDEVLDACIEDVFARIVLNTNAEAFPEYTGTVEKMIGYLEKKLQVGSELARGRLEKMHLPESIVYLEEIATLPEELKVEVEAVQISGGQAELKAKLKQLIDSKRVNQELLDQTEQMLQNEVQEDAQFRGTCWASRHGSAFTKNFQDSVKEFAANLQLADSEEEINRSLKERSALMSILDPHPIEGDLPVPPLVKPFMSFDENGAAIFEALKQSLSQLDIVRARRLGLEDMLKEIKTKDDILRKINEQDVVKFDKINVEISENFTAEHQILERIQAQNGMFSAIFNLEDFKALNKNWNEKIEAALAEYKEIKENINKWQNIQSTLKDIISDLKRQCHEYVTKTEGKEIILSMTQKRRELNTEFNRNETRQSPFPEATVNEYRKPAYPGRRNSDENVQRPGSESEQQQPPPESPPSYTEEHVRVDCK